MRILVLTPYFYPHIGGNERYIEELYSELMRQNPEFQVDIITYNTEGAKKIEKHNGFNVYRVGCLEILPHQFVLPNYLELFFLLKSLKNRKYTHVNAHARFFDVAWWGWLVARYFGAKSILTDHCASHPRHNNLIVQTLAKIVDLVAMPLLYKLYEKITVVSQATKDFWIKQVKKTEKIVVIPNSVKETLLTNKKDNKHKFSVRFIGRNVATKGANIFDEAVKNLQYKYPEIVFERVSDLAHHEAMLLLQGTDILVHPSIHHEGLPTIILEAGLAKCSVIASDAGGTKELIKDGSSGLLVEPTAQKVALGIEKLIKDGAKAKQMANGLEQRIKRNYLWKETAKKYSKLLFSLF